MGSFLDKLFKYTHRENRTRAETVYVEEPSTPVTRYVNFMLIQLFKADSQTKILYSNVELPPLTVESQTCDPPRLDEVVKRLKEMCDIEAGVHAIPVEGTVSCTFQGASFNVKCHFDHNAHACCWIRAEKSEEIRDCPTLDACHKNPIRTDGHRKIPYDSSQRQKPRKRKRIAGLVLLAVVLVAPVSWFTYCRHAENQLESLKDHPGFQMESVGPIWFRRLAGKFKLPVPKRAISFRGPHSSDEEIALVTRVRSLHTLLLDHSPVTDAGLVHLSRLRNLEVLSLFNTQVTDEGLASLSGLVKLRHLNLTDTQVTDEGLQHLESLKQLNTLFLQSRHVTDDGLASLSGLVNLTHLFIDGTKVTDKGLEHLKELKQLKILSLRGTSVTPKGVIRLKAAIPGLEVRAF